MIFFGSLFWDIFRKLKEKFHESTLLQQKERSCGLPPQSWFSGKCDFFNSFLCPLFGLYLYNWASSLSCCICFGTVCGHTHTATLAGRQSSARCENRLVICPRFQYDTNWASVLAHLSDWSISATIWMGLDQMCFFMAELEYFYFIKCHLFCLQICFGLEKKGVFFSANCELVWPCLTPHLVCLISPRQEAYGPSREPLSLLWLSWT